MEFLKKAVLKGRDVIFVDFPFGFVPPEPLKKHSGALSTRTNVIIEEHERNFRLDLVDGIRNGQSWR